MSWRFVLGEAVLCGSGQAPTSVIRTSSSYESIRSGPPQFVFLALANCISEGGYTLDMSPVTPISVPAVPYTFYSCSIHF